MDLIKLYLKKLEGDKLTTEEEKFFDLTQSNTGLIWDNMINFMESLIQWLKDVIKYYSDK